MSARTKKKFRIELQQEEYQSRLNGSGDVGAGAPNGSGHLEVLQAIQALRDDLAEGGAAGLGPDAERIIQEKVMIESELRQLSESLEETKREIAGLRYSSIHGDRIVSMNHQLDEVVQATEEATNKILAAAETIDADVQQLQANVTEEDEISALEKVGDEVIKIFEACNFQDLTGQRVTKVISTLKHVEDRVDAMIRCLGGDAAALETLVEPDDEDQSTEGIALHGPQSDGEGISQADIDSMFD